MVFIPENKSMPTIHFRGKVIRCAKDANLRQVLKANGLQPHNGASTTFNCFGLGTCGTCAVKVDGAVNALTPAEKLRLSFPPHKPENGLRLACQVKVLGDVNVIKGEGFWGQSGEW